VDWRKQVSIWLKYFRSLLAGGIPSKVPPKHAPPKMLKSCQILDFLKSLKRLTQLTDLHQILYFGRPNDMDVIHCNIVSHETQGALLI